MALFDKRSGAEKVIEMFDKLGDEDKEIVKSHFGEKATDVKKAEDEREVDKIEENKASNPEIKDEKKEEVKDESAEIGKNVDEAKKDESAEKPTEEPAKEEPKTDEVFEGLDARLKALEEKFDTLMSEEAEEPEHKEAGISGLGKSGADGMDIDTRGDDIIRKLGGRA